MPILDGFETAKAIREFYFENKSEKIPVIIACTGFNYFIYKIIILILKKEFLIIS